MRKILVLFACLLLPGHGVYAVDPTLNWKTIESEHLYVHFVEGDGVLAERVLAITEQAHINLAKELDWYPDDKTHVVLSDETDLPNGFANPVFFNRTVVFPTPPSSIDTLEDFDDWLTTVIVHEYTHIIHLDKSAGSPEYLRNIFGRFFLLFPNLFQPAWVVEGLATQMETDVERGVGRGQSAMFASMMRQEVANGVKPVSQVNLPVNTWPAGTTRYLYGVYFVQFLTETYGEDSMYRWLDEYSDNLLPFFVNTNADQTLGKNIQPLWQDFTDWLNDKFQPEIEAINASGMVMGSRLSKEAYHTDAVRALATDAGDEVYYVQNSGYKSSRLMHVDVDGKIEERVELNYDAELDVHEEAGVLITQIEYCNNYTVFKDIYLYDKENDRLERLTECGRYLYASWTPDGRQIIAVHNNAGRFELHLLNAKAQLQKILWQAGAGEILGQVDVSPDGSRVVAAKWNRGGGWNLGLFTIETGQWQKITRSSAITAYPQFDPEGNILFSMETKGVYNLHRYHFSTGKVEQLSNLIGGAFQSSQVSPGGAIYYVAYTAQGYAVYRLDSDKEQLRDTLQIEDSVWQADESIQLPDYPATATHQQSDYSALSNMYPRWWFPTYNVTEQRNEFGITTAGNDALAIHGYSVNVSYDSWLKRPAGQLTYSYADRFLFSVARQNEIELDLEGNLNRISSRDIAAMVVAFPRKRVRSQSDILLSINYDKTVDEELFGAAIPYESFEDHLLGLAWLYQSADYNPLSISLNDGMKLRLVAEDSDTLNSDFSGQIYTLDWRQYIRTGQESVLALRLLQGWGTDQPRPFKLGGEGFSDNMSDVLQGFDSNDSVFDRRKYALRGYKEGLPQLRGRRAQLLTAEWRFPLQRVERGIMAPPAGIMQYFGAVFAETGSAYQDSPETYYSSAGVELTVDFNLFYNLLLRSRFGYAHGFDEETGDDRLYLKIGSSF